MAAKPIERYVKKQIADQGGWPAVLDRIASGETISHIATTLLRPDGQPISYAFFRRLLYQDPERYPSLQEARRVRAEAWADQALAHSEAVPASRDDVAKARVVIDTRLRLAGLADRAEYGEAKPALTVSVNVASLHVDALRQRRVDAGAVETVAATVSHARVEQETVQSAMQPLALPTPSQQQDPSLT